MQKTLLLNMSYEPLSVIPWQKAMTMWCLEKVEVIAEYDEHHIRSASTEFKMPSIVRLLNYVRRTRLSIRFSRQNVYARDSHECQYCGARPAVGELTFDHVVPRSRGGKTSWDNIVTCCATCNNRKGSRTPKQAGMKLKKPPVKPKSYKNFTISVSHLDTPTPWLDYFS